ncbi:hypothetical protein JTE90_012587 [Oedothorax gibbosus]|uniref:Uncharacterized protein n=1 Tax=Oedothorax gibbosus TaxID=931172 RepID=A0AAV6V340_9ARAC|nr:hypothetical protein JTE90_012587 [Oedothorax gibbosus]
MTSSTQSNVKISAKVYFYLLKMAPDTTVVHETTVQGKSPEKSEYKTQVVWFNVLLFIYLHGSFLYGFYLGLTQAFVQTCVFAYIYGNLGGLGITAGAHRLWSHRSYKAKWPLRAFLSILSSIAAQEATMIGKGAEDVYQACYFLTTRRHRNSAKYVTLFFHERHLRSERGARIHLRPTHKLTPRPSADPHNIKRGFFFAHMGWLMCRKHPDVANKGKTVYLDDLWDDPVVRFQRKYYIPMVLFFSFYLPTVLPVWLWGETYWNAFFIAGMTRYCFSLNVTWLVNSAAHRFGDQPFDKYIEAKENSFVAFFAHGEGWHNYHHVFPWDYSTSELGYTLNLSKIFIDLMATIGQAYDLKTAHPEMIKSRKLKTGDGTRMKSVVLRDRVLVKNKSISSAYLRKGSEKLVGGLEPVFVFMNL